MVWSILSIRVLRYLVWAHHMFSIRMDTDSKAYFMAATVVIRVPTGVKIFRWLRHLRSTNFEFTISIAWVYFFIWLFTVRRVTRIVLSAASVDLLLHDTYYVLAHFHYVLSMRAVTTIVMRWYHWARVFTGTAYSDFLSWVFIVVFFIGVNITFFPMHLLRLERMPRRYCSYSTRMMSYNRIISLGALISISSLFISLKSLNPAMCNSWIFTQETFRSDPSLFFRQQSKAHSHMETPVIIFLNDTTSEI